jgi:hypothetical protein
VTTFFYPGLYPVENGKETGPMGREISYPPPFGSNVTPLLTSIVT